MLKLEKWRDKAACLGMGHLFFAPGYERRTERLRRTRAAKEICRGCPVQLACREAGYSEAHGVWGGHDRDE